MEIATQLPFQVVVMMGFMRGLDENNADDDAWCIEHTIYYYDAPENSWPTNA